MTPFLLLLLMTMLLWVLMIFFYQINDRFALIPICVFIGVSILLTHLLNDFGLAVVLGKYTFYLSTSFYTTAMLGTLILYLFNGPRSARLALIIMVAVTALYILLAFIITTTIDGKIFPISFPGALRIYFWSITAIIFDVLVMSFSWEIMLKNRWLPLFVRIFLITYIVLMVDLFIFRIGVSWGQSIDVGMFQAESLTRMALALTVTPILSFYLITKKFKESSTGELGKVTEILRSYLGQDSKVKTIEEYLIQENKLKQDLYRAKTNYELILNSVGVGVFDWDLNTDILTKSKKYYEMLGYREGDLPNTGSEFIDHYVHPDDQAEIRNILLPSKMVKNRKISDFRIKTADGKFVWFSGLSNFEYDETEKPIRIVGSIINIEDNKKFLLEIEKKINDLRDASKAMTNVLEDLQEEKKVTLNQKKDLEKYRLAVEAATDQIVISDNDGMVLYANPATEKLTGYTIKEALGKKAGKLWGGLMPLEYYKEMWKTIKNKKESFKGFLTNKRKNGEIYEATVNISPVLGAKGEVEFFVAIERDISKEKQLDKMKSEFLNMASHELRTPMTGIKGYVSMILDGDYGKVENSLREPLIDVVKETDRLINLVSDLLSVSRMEAGKLKLNIEQLHLSKVIKEIMSVLSVVVNSKNVKLKLEASDEDKVWGDVTSIKQVIENLVGNALKFTDKGEIIISVKKEKEMIICRVKDTGIGISEKDKERMFGRFEQISSQQIGKPQGTGLGLYISKELVEKMGGKIWLEESKLGKGSTFAFSLPTVKKVNN